MEKAVEMHESELRWLKLSGINDLWTDLQNYWLLKSMAAI